MQLELSVIIINILGAAGYVLGGARKLAFGVEGGLAVRAIALALLLLKELNTHKESTRFRATG